MALRPALNAPVLNVDFLPVGPARAAIVVFAEEYGGMGLALGIRSVETGQVVLFRNRERIDETTSLGEVLEPVLANAERMGFLFDEDMLETILGGDGRAQALGLWGRLMGEVETPEPRPAPKLPAATESVRQAAEIDPPETPELVLDEVANEEISLTDELPLEEPVARVLPVQTSARKRSRPAAKVSSDTMGATSLSKFRVPEDPPAVETGNGDTDEDETASALGRVPLVRVRRVRSDSGRVSNLAKLLSHF